MIINKGNIQFTCEDCERPLKVPEWAGCKEWCAYCNIEDDFVHAEHESCDYLELTDKAERDSIDYERESASHFGRSKNRKSNSYLLDSHMCAKSL